MCMPSGAPYWSHDDVIKWKHFLHYWPFVWGIHRCPVNSAHKGQRRGALMCSLICVWINGSVNKREAGDLRRHPAHYAVTIMQVPCCIQCDNSIVIQRVDRFTRPDSFARNTGKNVSQFLWRQLLPLVHNDLKKRLVVEKTIGDSGSQIYLIAEIQFLVFKLIKYLLQNLWYNIYSAHAHWAVLCWDYTLLYFIFVCESIHWFMLGSSFLNDLYIGICTLHKILATSFTKILHAYQSTVQPLM